VGNYTRFTVCALALAVAATVASAQPTQAPPQLREKTDAKPGLKIGVLGNATMSHLSGIDDDMVRHYGGALTLEVPLSSHFALVVQPGIVSKGTERYVEPYTTTTSGGTQVCLCLGNVCFCSGGSTTRHYEGYTYTRRLTYLGSPILLKTSFRSKGATPYILTGPSVGYLLSAKYNAVYDDGDTSENTDKDDLKSFDFGLAGGLGLSIPVGKKSWAFIEGQYHLGLTKIYDSGTSTAKNRAILINAGLTFGI
jgi:hypothetical protein